MSKINDIQVVSDIFILKLSDFDLLVGVNVVIVASGPSHVGVFINSRENIIVAPDSKQ